MNSKRFQNTKRNVSITIRITKTRLGLHLRGLQAHMVLSYLNQESTIKFKHTQIELYFIGFSYRATITGCPLFYLIVLSLLDLIMSS